MMSLPMSLAWKLFSTFLALSRDVVPIDVVADIVLWLAADLADGGFRGRGLGRRGRTRGLAVNVVGLAGANLEREVNENVIKLALT